MPIFEFKCSACGNEFEKLLRSSSSAPACPSCGGSELQKKISRFAAASRSAFGAVSGSSSLDLLPAGCPGCGGTDGSCSA